MNHSFVTIAIPFDTDHRKAVENALDVLGKPLLDFHADPTKPVPEVRECLNKTEIIHFMSMTVVRGDDERTADSRNGTSEKSFILIEASVDGEMDEAVETIAKQMEAHLRPVFRAGDISTGGHGLTRFLQRHRHDVGQGWFSTPGLNYDGTPDMSVQRIRAEAELAKKVTDMLQGGTGGATALATLEAIRSKLWEDSEKWAFVADPAPCLEARPAFGARPFAGIVASVVGNLLWPFMLASALIVLALFAWSGVDLLKWRGPIFWEVVLSWAGVLLVTIALVAGVLLWRERNDVPDDIPPRADHVQALMGRETFGAQNHLAASSIMKPGWLRRFTLRVGLWFAGFVGKYFSRPSFLGPLGTIHFARWIVLPGTNKVLFFSNYDGAWESYLEDFIESAHEGVTGIWSNTRGFPRTLGLIFKGAVDGDRLRRWTRRQQHPSLFWYVRYPQLSLARIRMNAAIRQGIAAITTEADAADWLACFGSSPRPANALQLEEIPTLVLGGLRRLYFGTCLFVRLRADNVAQNKGWLANLTQYISYGDHLTAEAAHVVAFSQSGLRKLGLSDEHLATFPVAFQQGSAAPWRARTLGDVREDDPEKWIWGGPANAIDAVLMVYATEADEAERLAGTRSAEIERYGGEIAFRLDFNPLPPRGQGKPREPFGFIDGVSQPIIRGIRAAKPHERSHLVNPGEFILGYPDNQNYTPPSPGVGPLDDPTGILPSVGADLFRQRPNFATPQRTAQRDLGMNGTFLVVRQLEQNVDAYHGFLRDAAKALKDAGRAPNIPDDQLPKWIGAKMTGRWQDGTSLVRHPYGEGTHRHGEGAHSHVEGTPPAAEGPESHDGDRRRVKPDNDFSFRMEDPNGLRCPFGAHIRRANPRDSFVGGPEKKVDGRFMTDVDTQLQAQIDEQMRIVNRHRILRVGRSYPKQRGLEHPGLVFMCLAADIERQFEFVQQAWVLGPSFQGLQDEIDPVVGNRKGAESFTIPTPEGPLVIKNIGDFVRVRGGGYFFLPGKRALQYLAHGAAARAA